MGGITNILQQLLVSEYGQEQDSLLLERFVRSRDQAAFAAIVQRHSPLVIRVCRGVLRNDADAEDASQATFLVLAQKAHRVRKGGSLASWLHGVAMRVALKLRAETLRSRNDHRDAEKPVSHDPAADLTVREAEYILHEELRRLPSRYRTPLILCYLLGKTHDEAAAAIGCSIAAFRGRLERARRSLHNRLVRRGLTLSAALLTSLLVDPRAAIGKGPAIVLARAAAAGLPTALANNWISARVYQLTLEIVHSMTFSLPKIGIAFVLLAALSGGIYAIVEPFVSDQDEAGSDDTTPGKLEGVIVASQYNRFLKFTLGGGEPVQIGGHLGDSEHIHWHRVSPNGKALAYQIKSPKGLFLFLWEFDQPWPGKELPAGRDYPNPVSWLADGKQLLLYRLKHVEGREPPFESEFGLLDVNTLTVTDLALPDGHVLQDVSPDGTWFLTMKQSNPSDKFGDGDFYRVEVQGSQTQLLFSDVYMNWAIRPTGWRISADGSQIAGTLMARRSFLFGLIQLTDGFQLFVGDLKSKKLRQATRDKSGGLAFLGWSPDGKKLLYETTDPMGQKAGETFNDYLIAIDPNGRNRTEITRHERRVDENGGRNEKDFMWWGDWRRSVGE